MTNDFLKTWQLNKLVIAVILTTQNIFQMHVPDSLNGLKKIKQTKKKKPGLFPVVFTHAADRI